MKAITLCADDFALSQAGSAGILQLLDNARLTATSVMVQSPHWPQLAPQLAAHSRHADIGLHFNLTQPFTASARPLWYWLARSSLRQLDSDGLCQQFLRQIDLFSEHFQRLPDFIDGHQHVHALPKIRQALFAAIDLRWPAQAARPYLRAPDQLGHPGGALLKAGIVQLASAGFSAVAKRQQLAYPSWFAGLYSLKPSRDYARLMQQWLHLAPSHALLMCHPGAAQPGDSIGAAREQEYQYLASERFRQHCQQAQVVLTRWQPHTTPA